MKKSKVAVLLSTYNGEEYIEKQIESIFNQSYDSMELYVRDDGSTDDTVGMLNELKEKYYFHLLEGNNIGFLKSFFSLLKDVKDADYYAFCDQDDVWLEDKINKAVFWFEQQSETCQRIPMIYHASYEVIDQDGKHLKNVCRNGEVCDFQRAITENYVSGFSMVINRMMREEMLKGDCDKIGYHDWWAFLIAQSLGTTYFDENITSLHRIHRTNETKITFKKRIKWFFENVRKKSDINERMCEFEKNFGDRLTKFDYELVAMFTKSNGNNFSNFKKAFFPRRWRSSLISEIVMRFLMLIGKI